LKIYLFRTELNLLTSKEISLIQITYFIVKCYVKCWIYAPEAIFAPLMDINLLHELYSYQYKKINKIVSEITIGRLINRLYYLTDKCVAFSLFDETININTKLKLAQKMLS